MGSTKEYFVETTYKLSNASLPKVNILDIFLDSAFKRGFDILAALFGLILRSPIFLINITMLKRESPGLAFYRGKRAGRDGNPFGILKFRTMYERPESYQGPAVTAQDDNRITPLGHWLRDTK